MIFVLEIKALERFFARLMSFYLSSGLFLHKKTKTINKVVFLISDTFNYSNKLKINPYAAQVKKTDKKTCFYF